MDQAFFTWLSDVWPKDKADGLRLGQSYMNNCQRGKPNPEIFYERDNRVALQKIIGRYYE